MPLRILLVDDTPAHLLLARHALEAVPDLDITSEESPAVAVQRIVDDTFDLVVTDLVFPSRLSGIDVAKTAQAQHIAVVIISGSYQRVGKRRPSVREAVGDGCVARDVRGNR